MMSKPTKETLEEQFNELCELMNSNHAACVHALALQHVRSSNSTSYKIKVSFARMEMINLDKCTLTYVECESNSMCMMKTAEIPFNPQLLSVKDALSRLLLEGQKAMAASWRWLYSEPVPLVVVFVMLVLGYITFGLEQNGLQLAIDNTPMASNLLTWTFGSAGSLHFAVSGSFYFAVFVHILEALYVAVNLKTKMKLPAAVVVNWFLLVSCVGYPISKRALEMINIDHSRKSKKQ